jgi:hypothetical protein
LTRYRNRRKLFSASEKHGKYAMRQKGRADIPQGLLVGLLALLGAATAHAQATSVDFQVVHLSGVRGSKVNYLAVRSQNEWIEFWRSGSLEPTLSGTPQPATAPRPPPPKIDFSRFILLIAETGVKPSSGYETIFESVNTAPDRSNKMMTSVHVIEMEPGNCPRLTQLTSSVSYALIPQTTNEIRFVVTKADSNCSVPVNPPFIK